MLISEKDRLPADKGTVGFCVQPRLAAHLPGHMPHKETLNGLSDEAEQSNLGLWQLFRAGKAVHSDLVEIPGPGVIPAHLREGN